MSPHISSKERHSYILCEFHQGRPSPKPMMHSPLFQIPPLLTIAELFQSVGKFFQLFIFFAKTLHFPLFRKMHYSPIFNFSLISGIYVLFACFACFSLLHSLIRCIYASYNTLTVRLWRLQCRDHIGLLPYSAPIETWNRHGRKLSPILQSVLSVNGVRKGLCKPFVN